MGSQNVSTSTGDQTAKTSRLARGLGVAACAGMAACMAACALTAATTALLGAGAAASFAHVLGPGSELAFGGSAFVIALVATAWLRRRKQRDVGGACCVSTRAEQG